MIDTAYLPELLWGGGGGGGGQCNCINTFCAFDLRAYVYVSMTQFRRYVVGRPGFLDLNAAILSSFGCNSIIVVLRWFLSVKMVKPAVLR